MTVEEHLRAVLARYWADNGTYSPVRGVLGALDPVLRKWGGQHIVGIRPSGSFAKGTAVKGGTDIDIFISLTSNLTDTLEQIYQTLFNALTQAGYAARRQNVSIGTTVNGWKIDVTPGRRQDQYSKYHSLWSNNKSSWLQTNIDLHIQEITQSQRYEEIKLLKIWRNNFKIEWPSFYLELFTIDSLKGARIGNLEGNMSKLFQSIERNIERSRLLDPANTNNVVSDTLTYMQKSILSQAAGKALSTPWNVVFQ